MWETLSHEFSHPSNSYRGKPFWSWNGRLERAELLRQIQVMREMGFGGFFMHSRTGLMTEYLGEEWFAHINACTDEAAQLGMEAWLYDEDRWPSGTAGGRVTVEPRFRMKYLALHLTTVGAFQPSPPPVAVFTAVLDGLILHDYTPIELSTLAGLAVDTPLLAFTLEEMPVSPFYNGYTYVDTLNRAATERFIELTHKQYEQYCGTRLGTTIQGIFTDEPHRGQLMTSFGSTSSEENAQREWSVPWTYDLFPQFHAQFGYDLQTRLPELFFWYRGSKVSSVKWHYTELLQRMFLENFVQPLNAWSSAHHLRLTGHFLHEDSLTAQTAMGGSMLRLYEHMSNPGVDVLSEFNRSYWIVKQLASAARQLERPWLLSELYGCTGWQMSFEGHKAVGDWQALFGINQRCPHLSWFTMQGEAKRDYPASILHQSAWWKEYAFVESYFARIGVVMSHGHAVCETLVISPLESVWCQIYPGWCAGLTANDPAIKRLEEQYMTIFHWLAGAQIDFDYGDEEMLSRLGSVSHDQEGRPLLRLGAASYRQVLIAGMTTIRSTTLALLQAFIAAGGIVLFAGAPPAYVDALPADDCMRLADSAFTLDFERDSIVTACRQHSDTLVTVCDQQGNAVPDIFLQVRADGTDHALFLLNSNREMAYPQVTITIARDGYVQEWQCASGERYHIAASQQSKITFTAHFPAGGEHLYIVTAQRAEHLPVQSTYSTLVSTPLPGPFAYTLDEPNILVLDYASYRIDQGAWQPEAEILKIDRQVRQHFDLPYRAGNMLQPWFTRETPRTSLGRLQLRFDFFVDVLPESLLALAMECPEQFRVSINGHVIDISKQDGWWVDLCFKRIPIAADLLIKGLNTLVLETDFHQGRDLEALYLLGNFGVQAQGTRKTLCVLPSQLAVGDITRQGLPFYSGKITYLLETTGVADAQEECFLTLDRFGGACVRVNPGAADEHLIAWQPYEATITSAVQKEHVVPVEVILTRRNTFGPLHQLPLITEWTGPDNFLTEGAHFTSEYMLIPNGLLEVPHIVKRREEKQAS